MSGNLGVGAHRPAGMTRRSVALALVVPALVMVAACADGGADAAGPSPATSSSPSAVAVTPTSGTPVVVEPPPRPTAIAPVAPGEGPAIPADQVDASAVRALYEAPTTADPTGTALTITVVIDPCTSVSGTVENQDATTVTVQLREQSDSAGACSTVGVLTPVDVSMTAPLGDRTLVIKGR